MNITDKNAFYRKIHRVLKPGGWLALSKIAKGEGVGLTIQPLGRRARAPASCRRWRRWATFSPMPKPCSLPVSSAYRWTILRAPAQPTPLHPQHGAHHHG